MQLSAISLALTRAGVVSFSPMALFSNGEQGVFYDIADYTTLFEDAAGTIPITSPLEKPVGLMLDKSKGMVLGPELVTNGTFDTATTGWTARSGTGAIAAVSGQMRITNSSTSYGTGYQSITTTAGKSYKVTLTAYAGTAATVYAAAKDALITNPDLAVTSTTSKTLVSLTFVFTAASATTLILCVNSNENNATGYFDNISVRELPGNHAYQSTTTSRPTLSARYNLLTKTEQFDDAVWTKTNATVAAKGYTDPLGGNTARLMVTGSTASTNKQCFQSYTPVAGVIYTASVFVKDAASGYRNFFFSINQISSNSFISLIFNLDTGVITTNNSGTGVELVAASKSTANNGFTALFLQFKVVSGGAIDVMCQSSYLQALAGSYYIWGADLRVANDGVGLPAYQRVNTATDYDYAGFPPYLKFDGTDDSMATGNIDFTGTDKMSVFAGVRKLSDAASGALAETSSNVVSNSGAFAVFSPDTSTDYGLYVKGSAANGRKYSTYTAPISNVMSCLLTTVADNSSSAINVRINAQNISGSNVASNASAGAFGAYPLYIGRRGGSTHPFNGRLYGLTVVGKTASATEISSTEAYLNNKTKAY